MLVSHTCTRGYFWDVIWDRFRSKESSSNLPSRTDAACIVHACHSVPVLHSAPT